jgi:integrase
MIVKLTKRAVDTLAPIAKPFVAYDADLPGFGLRVMPSGVKSFVVEYRPNGGGRGVAKRRVTIGKVGALTPEQARKAAGELLARARLGADPAQEIADRRKAQTVAALCDAFEVEHVDGKLKPSTRVSYKAALARLKDAHGSAKAESVTRAQIATLHAKLATSPYVANRALSTWAKLFAWGMARGFVPKGDNPAREIDRYRESKRERFLTAEELARLGAALAEGETAGLPYAVDATKAKAKHAPKPENRLVKLDPFAVAAIRLLILTGARLREIMDAQWSQVDFQRGMLFLADSKTGRKPIYLGAAALAVLADLPRIEGNPHIIAGAKDGAPRADLQRPWAAVRQAAGLEGVRLHDLRHSFASVGAGASLGLPIIGKLLGHTQAATTARYAHLDADPLRRAADTIGATIAAAMQRKAGAAVAKLKETKRSGRR